MNKWIARVGATVSLAAIVTSVAIADGAKTTTSAKAALCPVCKMALSTKKTKDNTVAVKVNGKTLYCCSKCIMKKPAASKAKS